jgi:hypothetical protein
MFGKAKKTRQPRFGIGDNVRVASKEMINGTLDSEKKLEGCLFMNQMYQYCGHEFTITQIVTKVYMDKLLKLRTPFYILEGLRCDGIVESFEHQCDRTCNLLWHEAWLEKGAH